MISIIVHAAYRLFHIASVLRNLRDLSRGHLGRIIVRHWHAKIIQWVARALR